MIFQDPREKFRLLFKVKCLNFKPFEMNTFSRFFSKRIYWTKKSPDFRALKFYLQSTIYRFALPESPLSEDPFPGVAAPPEIESLIEVSA